MRGMRFDRTAKFGQALGVATTSNLVVVLSGRLGNHTGAVSVGGLGVRASVVEVGVGRMPDHPSVDEGTDR
jgi:hypothetical protein